MAFQMNPGNLFSTVLLSACLSLTACKTIETPNGELPDEAMAYAGQVVGTYQNRADLSEITVSLSGKRLIATHSSKNNLDVLESKCDTDIGLLREIRVGNDGKKIRGTFDFNRNYCTPTLVGTTIELQVSEAQHSQTGKVEKILTVTYLLDAKQEQQCSFEYPPGMPPKQVCTIQTTPVYFQKNFVRR